MGKSQKLILALIFMMSLPVKAEWQATFNRMGFFGDLGFGIIYDWDNPHSAEFSIGAYQINYVNFWQSNLAYRYSRWEEQFQDISWIPIQLGIFTVRTWDQSRYFLSSPPKYPYENYYDQNAFRWGLEFGSVIKWTEKDLSIAYHLRILDSGIVAIYNNAGKDLQYYISSGLAVSYHFD